jgi:hypothetical protein
MISLRFQRRLILTQALNGQCILRSRHESLHVVAAASMHSLRIQRACGCQSSHFLLPRASTTIIPKSYRIFGMRVVALHPIVLSGHCDGSLLYIRIHLCIYRRLRVQC